MRTVRIICVMALSAAFALLGVTTGGSAGAVPYPPITCAHIAVSTTTPHPGQQITVTGSGYQADESITLELHSATVVLAQVSTDANGSFSTSVTIPADTSAGSHLLVAVGGTSSCPVDPITLTIQGGAGVEPGSTGRLPAFTGVAIASALLIAAGLLAVGLVAARAGRRRRPLGRHTA
jgi:hypothetical protein